MFHDTSQSFDVLKRTLLLHRPLILCLLQVVRAQTSSGFERPSDRVGSCAGQHLPPEREARRPHQQQPSSATAAHAFVGTLGGGFTPQLAGVRQPAADAAAATSTTTPPHNRQLQQPSAPTSSAEGQHHHHHGHTVKSAPYHLLAPNWDPLVGRSRQHLRVQKEVRCCVSATRAVMHQRAKC